MLCFRMKHEHKSRPTTAALLAPRNLYGVFTFLPSALTLQLLFASLSLRFHKAVQGQCRNK
jgi:hypothetical protein